MGHYNIYTLIDLGYKNQREKEKEGISRLEDRLEQKISTEDIQGYTHGYQRDISMVFDDKDSALKYIGEKLSKDEEHGEIHSYKALYMASRSAKLASLEKRLESEEKKLKDYEINHAVTKLKAEFIGCPKCKSKLSKRWLEKDDYPNNCPLCGEDLRSKTVIDTINRYEKNINELKHEIASEEKRLKTVHRKSKYDIIATLLYIVTDIHE